MAILRYNEIKKMDSKTKKEKLKNLEMELIKANVTANLQNSKTKEIKRAISRILTSDRLANAENAEVSKK